MILFFITTAFAAEKIDFTLCNGGKGRGGNQPFASYSQSGKMEFDKKHIRTMLISQKGAELSFYEFAPLGERDKGLVFGAGDESLAKVKYTLTSQNSKPGSLRIQKTWKKSKDKSWTQLKKELPKWKEFTGRETKDWVSYGYSSDRCFVKQEGSVSQKKKYVSFDFDLCEQILRITDRKAAELRDAWKGEPGETQKEASRVLQLIRGAIIRSDEKLKAKNLRLMAAMSTLFENHLANGTHYEEGTALRELTQCEARLDADELPAVKRGHETMDELEAPAP